MGHAFLAVLFFKFLAVHEKLVVLIFGAAPAVEVARGTAQRSAAENFVDTLVFGIVFLFFED